MADISKRHRLRNIWYGIVHRTTNPKHGAFPNYGGRGVTLCDEWHSLDKFISDMGDAYTYGLTIGRIDNATGYSKENCRWETAKEQANNRRSSRVFTLDGMTKTLAQWIEHYGLKSSTVRQRLYTYSWGIERSLDRKVG